MCCDNDSERSVIPEQQFATTLHSLYRDHTHQVYISKYFISPVTHKSELSFFVKKVKTADAYKNEEKKLLYRLSQNTVQRPHLLNLKIKIIA